MQLTDDGRTHQITIVSGSPRLAHHHRGPWPGRARSANNAAYFFAMNQHHLANFGGKFKEFDDGAAWKPADDSALVVISATRIDINIEALYDGR